MKIDTDSIIHIKWNCKYHIVFAPKYDGMLVAISPKFKVAQIMGYLIRESCQMISKKHVSMKYKYRNRQFKEDIRVSLHDKKNDIPDLSIA